MTRFPPLPILLALALSGPGEALPEEKKYLEEIHLGAAAAQSVVFPAWNSIRTGEDFLAYLQAAADVIAVACMGSGSGTALSLPFP